MLDLIPHFLDHDSLNGLPEHEIVGRDKFPLFATSQLRDEHDFLSRNFDTHRIVDTDDLDVRTKRFAALLDRVFYYDLQYGHKGGDPAKMLGFFWQGPATYAFRLMLEAGVRLDALGKYLLRWFSMGERTVREPRLFDAMINALAASNVAEQFKRELIVIRSKFLLKEQYTLKKQQVARIDELLGSGLWQLLIPGEKWSDTATAEIESMSDATREAWCQLLQHCQRPEVKKQTMKPTWLSDGQVLRDNIGEEEFRAKLLAWLPLVSAGPGDLSFRPLNESTEQQQVIHQGHALVLRGLTFLSVDVANDEVLRAIRDLTETSFVKLKGLGPRNKSVGEAGLAILAEVKSDKSRELLRGLVESIKQPSIRKKIDLLLDE